MKRYRVTGHVDGLDIGEYFRVEDVVKMINGVKMELDYGATLGPLAREAEGGIAALKTALYLLGAIEAPSQPHHSTQPIPRPRT